MKSIWIEKELVDLLIQWDYCKKSGAWISVNEALREELAQNDLEMPEKIHGMMKLFDFLEQNPKLVEYLFSKFKNVLSDLQ